MLRLLIMSFRAWLKAESRKFCKLFKALPCLCYAKIKFSALGLDGNIALDFSSRYITISSARLLRIALAAML